MIEYSRDYILEQSKNKNIPSCFKLRNFYELEEWNNTSLGDRITVGRMFSKDVRDNAFLHIKNGEEDLAIIHSKNNKTNTSYYEKAICVFRYMCDELD